MGASWAGNGRITGKADALAALQRVNAQAQTRGATALLPHAVQTADTATVGDNITAVLPTHPSVQPLLPWPGGIKRGATVSVTGSTSLLMMLLAGMVSRTGAWAAVVGMPQFGVLAAVQDYNVPAERLALVPEPGPDWPNIVSALLDGLDVVIVQPPADVPESLARALSSRARQKGAVLLPTRNWPGAELAINAGTPRWHGLGDGRGRLKHCDLEVRSTGRGKAVRPRKTTLSLPPGAKRPPVRIPPPQTVTTAEHQAVSPLWAKVEPTPPPTNPWTALTAEFTAPRTRKG